MKRHTVKRVVGGIMALGLALGACKAANGPGAGSPRGGDGNAIAIAKPVLYDDEKAVGKS